MTWLRTRRGGWLNLDFVAELTPLEQRDPDTEVWQPDGIGQSSIGACCAFLALGRHSYRRYPTIAATSWSSVISPGVRGCAWAVTAYRG